MQNNKTVQTVTGAVLCDDLGDTMTHEHLWFNCKTLYEKAHPDLKMSNEKISLEIRPRVMENLQTVVFGYGDNLIFDDVDLIVEELIPCKTAGCKTIVDVSTIDLARNPEKLKEISQKSGMQIIMGGGYYYFPALDQCCKDEIILGGKVRLADRMIKDVTEGVGNTGIRAGVIGEIGPGEDEGSQIIMHAAAIAQKETGVPLIVHYAPMEMIDIVEEEGGDVTKLVMGHWGIDCAVDEAIKRGAWVSFDQFGMNFEGIKNDEKRIEEVLEILSKGYIKRLLLSQDVCYKTRLKRFGGKGYSELFTDIRDCLIKRGMTEEQWNTIICKNIYNLFS